MSASWILREIEHGNPFDGARGMMVICTREDLSSTSIVMMDEGRWRISHKGFWHGEYDNLDVAQKVAGALEDLR